MDRHHIEILTFDLDSGGVMVWGIMGSYTTGDSSITVTLERGDDGTTWIDDTDLSWQTFIDDQITPNWG